MTVEDALALGATDAALLLAFVLHRNRAWLIAHPEAELREEQIAAFQSLCRRRERGEPLAYVVGRAGFYGREFRVDRTVLIPRPETEHMVEEAVAFLRACAGDRARALDIGTGSGAIACTLAAEVSGAHVDAIDVSAAALTLARDNAAALGVTARCRFLLGDLVEPLAAGSSYAVIVANLPYVPTADIAIAPDPVSFEPRAALDGGADGLALYRRLLPRVGEYLLPGGLLLAEAAPPLMDALMGLVRAAMPHAEASIGVDYGGRQRFVRVRAE